MLAQQHEDLDRLEAEDAALNGGEVNEEVEKVLRKPDSISFAASTMRKAKMGRGSSKTEEPLDLDLHLPEPRLEGTKAKLRRARRGARDEEELLPLEVKVMAQICLARQSWRGYTSRICS